MKIAWSVKVDLKLKKAAQKLAKELGIPLSLVINNALKVFINTRSITIDEH